MSRALPFVCGLLLVAGCQAPPERPPVPLLPEDSAPQAYRDLVNRARAYAANATEAFYVNNWDDLEGAAKGLEQTARFLPKSTEVPESHQAKLKDEAEGLRREAESLGKAARAKDEKLVNEVMRNINLKVRVLRPEK